MEIPQTSMSSKLGQMILSFQTTST
ncbi:hypothetical protein RDI58_013575 [Solanum bulbocastanum]|uniref:Uncharacterized protein n=1 Tax=Solanum bulbocastanum TaxID=147425 RepID=A0AAN8YE99_SOLBU